MTCLACLQMDAWEQRCPIKRGSFAELVSFP